MTITQYNYEPPKTKTFSSFDTSFIFIESPVTLDVNIELSKNSNDGFIINNGKGRLTYQISSNGSTFDDAINLEPCTGHSLKNISVDSIKITYVADTSYEVVLW